MTYHQAKAYLGCASNKVRGGLDVVHTWQGSDPKVVIGGNSLGMGACLVAHVACMAMELACGYTIWV